MAKKTSSERMSPREYRAGTVFFLLYLLVFPLFANKLFDLLGRLFGTAIDGSLQNVLYYYLLFAVTLLIFFRFIGGTTRRFFDEPARALRTYLLGLVFFYGGNELLYRVMRSLFDSQTNLNDTAIAAQISAAPRMTVLIVLALAPFVEEVLFRGLVFGGLCEKSRVLAYVVSCVLFAFLHVWTFALSSWDLRYFGLMLQYLAPGLVFAWAYEHSGTLWTAILLHTTVNALSLLAIFA